MTIEPYGASRDPDPEAERYRVLSLKTIAWTAAFVVLVGVGLAVWLLFAYGHGDAKERNQLEAIKTAGTIVVGTGGAVALLLAARRQRTAEIALKQKDRDQLDVARAYALQVIVAEQTRAHQERVAASTEDDAIERRVTELYTKAVEQLGSEKAAVRLGGLYALERLAQANISQRPTVVNVLCAYLRMPYQPPESALATRRVESPVLHSQGGDSVGVVDEGVDRDAAESGQRTQELQVRLTAQRILTDHLRPGPDSQRPPATFWSDSGINLTGAVLIDFDMEACQPGAALFENATFFGEPRFANVTFTGDAQFIGANFTEFVDFGKATFARSARFNHTSFARHVQFAGATFTQGARFDWVTFTGGAWFGQATFAQTAWFGRATFTGDGQFNKATFTGGAEFNGATFTDEAIFTGATFTDSAAFGGATFTGDARFDWATFKRRTRFVGATFTGDAEFDGAVFSDPGGVSRALRGARFADFSDFPRTLPPGLRLAPSDGDGWREVVAEDDGG